MGLFKRLFKVGQAHANKAVDGLEDPSVMLEQAIRDGDIEIKENRKQLQKLLAQVKQQEASAKTHRMSQSEWEEKAGQALDAGNEDLATRALERATEEEENAEIFEKQHQALLTEFKKLEVGVKAKQKDLEDTKRDKDVILAQLEAADVKKELNETKASIGTSGKSSGELIARMRKKANQTVAEADAAEDMAELAGDSLEAEFDKLGTPSKSVADKLAAMKAKRSK